MATIPTLLSTQLYGNHPRPRACELQLLVGSAGSRLAAAVPPHPERATASRSALSRRPPSAFSRRPPSGACEAGAGGGLCANRPRLRSQREEAGGRRRERRRDYAGP